MTKLILKHHACSASLQHHNVLYDFNGTQRASGIIKVAYMCHHIWFGFCRRENMDDRSIRTEVSLNNQLYNITNGTMRPA